MIKVKEIFLQITFLLVITSFYGIAVFSYFHTQQPYACEMTGNENTVEYDRFSEFDVLEDIHVVKKEIVPGNTFVCKTKVRFAKTFFIILHPSFSIWQPPKLV
ncbi:hypothetical protein SDC9_102561 [bioreactor metagenome]|uniref:Uncharacterized protein n=1 Tax=bioreactor metagenome TaxID=1076179 RepID=A0A645B222_9ZZZZ|nr:hypothetical protein [Paludibacter sp.]